MCIVRVPCELAVGDTYPTGCLNDSDIPNPVKLSANPDFDTLNVLSVPPVRKALLKIRATVEILAGKSKYLQDGMLFFEIMKTHRKESNAVQIGRDRSPSTSATHTKEQIRALKVDKFSGKLEELSSGNNLLTWSSSNMAWRDTL